jgi:hypothetical protein
VYYSLTFYWIEDENDACSQGFNAAINQVKDQVNLQGQQVGQQK